MIQLIQIVQLIQKGVVFMLMINLQGNEAIFEQIKKQIIRFISTGILIPNEKLPSVRTLAQELNINPNTVQKAYQELESEGYVYTLVKKGVFVSDKTSTLNKTTLVIDQLKQLVKFSTLSGITKEELKQLIDEMEVE